MARSSLEAILPLSGLQEGILFHALFDSAGIDPYVVQIAMELRGPLQAGRLRAACQQLLDRHPNLRAAFAQRRNGQPVQLIPPAVAAPWQEHDLTGQPPARQQQRLRQLLTAHGQARFDMTTPPLIRFALIRLSPQRHILAITNHHILLDGWSMSLLLRDLLTCYTDGDDRNLPPVTPYQHYLSWLAAQDPQAARDAWAQALAGLEHPTLIAPGAPASTGTAPATITTDLSPQATAALTATARTRHLTLNTVIQTTWALLLHSLTGAADITFGATVSGRPRPARRRTHHRPAHQHHPGPDHHQPRRNRPGPDDPHPAPANQPHPPPPPPPHRHPPPNPPHHPLRHQHRLRERPFRRRAAERGSRPDHQPARGRHGRDGDRSLSAEPHRRPRHAASAEPELPAGPVHAGKGHRADQPRRQAPRDHRRPARDRCREDRLARRVAAGSPPARGNRCRVPGPRDDAAGDLPGAGPPDAQLDGSGRPGREHDVRAAQRGGQQAGALPDRDGRRTGQDRRPVAAAIRAHARGCPRRTQVGGLLPATRPGASGRQDRVRADGRQPGADRHHHCDGFGAAGCIGGCGGSSPRGSRAP